MSITLIDNTTQQRYEFETVDATRGAKGIDFSKLYERTGLLSYDVGYASTAGCKSTISYIDGQKGELYYKGYPVEELVEKYQYSDICRLLLTDELPKNATESLEFELELRHRSFIHETLHNMFLAFPTHAHPMAKLSSGVSILSTLYSDHEKMENEEDYQTMARRIIAKMPTLAAICYRNETGAPVIHPDVARGYVENILFMLRAYPHGRLKHGLHGEVEINPLEIEAFDKILTLHADHGQNASSTTVRNVASTGVHPYAAISAGISTLWGHLHGGANEKVLLQLEEIGDVKHVDKYIARVKDKNDPFKLMGFGHRVYKSYDPRARILKKLKDDLQARGIKMNPRLDEIAAKVEEVALQDEYFVARNLYPNVDFYSGTILTALKIPTRFFTPVFVIGRTVGWCAQLLEHVKNTQARITRPRQIYVGK
ncbi:citrate synthase [Helicobacter salomonis]|uniref:citrate synthase n=1 Tax=Helicobacter salomonis TaxID=56878 RepID=UPI000CF185DD|nr:citrate synthase [Helicobacter salomonis]